MVTAGEGKLFQNIAIGMEASSPIQILGRKSPVPFLSEQEITEPGQS
jgi:hypothetical protein